MDIGPDPDLSDSDDSFYMGITERPIPVEELSEVEQQRIKLETFYGIVTCNSKKGLLDLLNKGIHVDTNIRDEWTPLLLSCSLGHFEMVTILLAHGADVNQSRGLVTPLMLASSRRTTRSIKSEDIMGIVKLLVENGANVKALDRTRKTALMYAAYEGNLNVVQYLLPLSDREASDNQLWNALTYAVKGKHLDIVKYLISQNFCLDNVDVRGNSLYDIASENNSKEILNLLPKPVLDTVIDDLPCSSTFNEEFYDADETPYLLGEIRNILYSINCDMLLPFFDTNNLKLEEFLCLTNEELKQLEIQMPIHRYKILEALYSFHLRPFSSKSVYICLNKESFSNKDVAIQLTSAVYQITAMNSSIKFILKNVQDLSEEEKQRILDAIKPIKQLLHFYENLSNRLNERIYEWDKLAKAPDYLTKKSVRSTFPWGKIAISCGVLGGLLFLVRSKYIF